MAYKASAVGTSTGSTTTSLTWPSVAAHDRALLFVSKDASFPGTVTPPSGFSLIGDIESQNLPDSHTYILYENRDLVGTESGTLTLTTDATQNCVMFLVVLSGRDNAAALTFATFTNDTNANASPVSLAAASGTAVAGDDLVAFFGLDQTAGGDVWDQTAPSGFTERHDQQIAWVSASVSTKDNQSAGAVGTVTGTATRSSGSGAAGWGAFVVAVPAGAVVAQPANSQFFAAASG